MLHLFVYLCFQLIKQICIEIFFFINRFNHVEAQEPVTLFCLILDICKSNQKMKHTIRFLLARRFLCHNKPNIKILRRHFPFNSPVSLILRFVENAFCHMFLSNNVSLVYVTGNTSYF